MERSVQVIGLDHIVLNVTDVERSLAFYCETLGLSPVRVDEWRKKEVRFPSVRVNEAMIIDLFENDRAGENLDHFCLVVEPTDLEALKSVEGLKVVQGPSKRFGARGIGVSLYVSDPDGNRVELRYYE